MFDDPIINEVRKVRAEIAARFNYDVSAIGAYYQELQTQSGMETVTRAPKRVRPNIQADETTEPPRLVESRIAA